MKKFLAKNLQSRHGAVTIALLWAIAIASGLTLRNTTNYQPAYTINNESQEAVNNTPFALILGEIRASAADLMWVKTERYLHKGVAYAPHVDEAEVARSGETATIDHTPTAIPTEDHDHEAGHKGPDALVPDATKDYRGFVGTLQREVQPWLPPGSPDEHTGTDELLPWYRMLTYANPHHWRGYMIGTWWLMQHTAENPKSLDEATQFITEGIRNNPGIFQLRLMQGRLLMQREQWRPSIAAFRDALKIAEPLRPADGKPKEPVWTDSDEEDFRAVARYIPFIYMRKLNDPATALREINHVTSIIPSDVPLMHMRNELALIPNRSN